MTVSDFYERYWRRAGGSPADHGHLLAERKALLRQSLAGVAPGAAILDAGCGNGEFILYLQTLGYDVSAVDISTSAVARAREAAPQATCEVASLESGLPFRDGQFAAAWCTEVLEHLFDVHAALAELNRVLTPGGLLVLTAPYHGLIKNLAVAAAGFDRHYNPYLSHIRFFTRKTLDTCLRNAGFTTLSWGGVGRRWPLWMSHFVVARKTATPGPPPEIVG